MIEVREALKRLCDEAAPLEVTEVGLDEAHGRVLAEEVRADRDFPPTDRSAMDGFAIRTTDLGEERTLLNVVGEARAGGFAGGTRVEAGEAIRIMTGATVPPGADAVVRVEDTHEDRATGRVTIHHRPQVGEHVRCRGGDVEKGEVVLRPGRAIHAPEIAVLSSVGRTQPRVHRRPVVGVLTTGDEIVEPDRTPLDHQLRNSNGPTLMAQLRELGLRGRRLGIASDDRAGLARMIEEGLSTDVLLITGGVSVGEYDLVGEVLAEAGMRLLFHKVAVKPGKPMLAGRCGDCLVVGLPGNPVSTYTGFAIFVAPALRRMMGYAEWRNLELSATLERPLRAGPKRQTYHLARVSSTPDGLTACPSRNTGSGDVLSLAGANGFVVTSVGCSGLAPGTLVPTLLWSDFHLR
jgi:molybdopterin molybdotransferase